MVLICIFYYSISFSVIKILNFEILIFFAKKFDLEKFSTIFFLNFFFIANSILFCILTYKDSQLFLCENVYKTPKMISKNLQLAILKKFQEFAGINNVFISSFTVSYYIQNMVKLLEHCFVVDDYSQSQERFNNLIFSNLRCYQLTLQKILYYKLQISSTRALCFLKH